MRSRSQSWSQILKVSVSEGVVLISEGLVSVSVLVLDGQVSVLVSFSDFEAETPSLQCCFQLYMHKLRNISSTLSVNFIRCEGSLGRFHLWHWSLVIEDKQKCWTSWNSYHPQGARLFHTKHGFEWCATASTDRQRMIVACLSSSDWVTPNAGRFYWTFNLPTRPMQLPYINDQSNVCTCCHRCLSLS